MRPGARRTAIVAGLLLAALAAGCGGGGTASPARPGERANEARIYLANYPPSLCLIGKTDSSTEEVAIQISDSLVQYDPQLELEPRVARNWSFSPDRRTLTFTLRDGVRWHDGLPVTADDVVFTIERLRDPVMENRVWAPSFVDLESVVAPDDHTVVARYSVATPDVLEGWRVPLLPRHLAADDEDLMTGSFARSPVGCGPFRFVSADSGRRIELEANDDYWDGRPHLDRLIFKVFEEQRTGYQALLTGDLDVMPVTSNLLAAYRESGTHEGLDSFTFTRLNVTYIAWNQDGSNPFFDDAGVRRALLLALDRPAFSEAVVDGLATPAVTTYPLSGIWADPELAPLPHDPQAARRLLDEAGWVDGDGDGVRERDGRPFRFTLLINESRQALVDRMAAWAQQSWASIGVDCRIEKLEFQAARERRFSHRFEAALGTFTLTPNPDQSELYASSARDDGYNFFGLADAEVDRLLQAGRTTFDPSRRREIYRALQRRLAELQPVAALFDFDTPVLLDARLRGVTPSPLGFLRTTQGPRTWSWPDE